MEEALQEVAGERTELAEKGQLWGDRGRLAKGGGEGDNLGARGLGSLKTAKCDQRNPEGPGHRAEVFRKLGWGCREGAGRKGRVAGHLWLRGEGK